ncbi:uncharacterized protein LOC107001280 [Solanum pennellii]|uniref:Uncharacterized protein LOC107001280 n=1 Tax=Solanum pennellii TaxID=28526 RepID=A0ABM1FCF8_SOLPN|nr:uncharacterized protein LOC107001280 [Solanum pennellii]
MAPRRWEEEGVHEEVPQGNEVSVVPPDMTNGEIRESLFALARVIKTHVTRGVEPIVDALGSTMTSRLGYFLRMNPPLFLGSKVGKNPQEFLHGVYKVLSSMGVTSRDNEELALYQLTEVSQVWYTQGNDKSLVESGPIEWEEFERAFLGKYFLHVRRKVKIGRFIDLFQGKGNVEESKLSKSARILRRSSSSDQSQPRFKNRALTQDGPSSPKVKLEKGSGSQGGKTTCVTCRKSHLVKRQVGTGNFFECGKKGHQRRDCPIFANRRKEGQASSS